jgi:hypothetical protein
LPEWQPANGAKAEVPHRQSVRLSQDALRQKWLDACSQIGGCSTGFCPFEESCRKLWDKIVDLRGWEAVLKMQERRLKRRIDTAAST